jgi:hypothetical protein
MKAKEGVFMAKSVVELAKSGATVNGISEMSIKQYEYLIGVAKRNKIKYNELKLKDRVKKFTQGK